MSDTVLVLIVLALALGLVALGFVGRVKGRW